MCFSFKCNIIFVFMLFPHEFGGFIKIRIPARKIRRQTTPVCNLNVHVKIFEYMCALYLSLSLYLSIYLTIYFSLLSFSLSSLFFFLCVCRIVYFCFAYRESRMFFLVGRKMGFADFANTHILCFIFMHVHALILSLRYQSCKFYLSIILHVFRLPYISERKSSFIGPGGGSAHADN